MTDPNSCDLLIQRALLFDGAGTPLGWRSARDVKKIFVILMPDG